MYSMLLLNTFKDVVHQNAKFVNIPHWSVKFSQVEVIIKKFLNIGQYSPSDIVKLHEEFFEYQLLTD